MEYFARLRILFTVGGHFKDESSGQLQQKNQDGRMSSLLTFMLLLGLGMTLSIGHYLTTETMLPLSNQAVELCLILYMTAGCVVMVTYMIFPKPSIVKVTENADSANPVEGVLRRYLRTKLVIIGLIVFYILGCFVDVFKIIAAAECTSSFYICGLLFANITSIFFHSVRLIFMGIMVIFAVQFDKIVFKRRPMNYYCLMIPTAAILTIWFDSVLYELSNIIMEIDPGINTTWILPNVNVSNAKNIYLSQCLTKTTKVYKLESSISRYLYSCNVEFALLATKVFCDLFFGMDLPYPDETNQNIEFLPDENSSTEPLLQIQISDEDESTCNSSTPLKNFNQSDEEDVAYLSDQPFQHHIDYVTTQSNDSSPSRLKIPISAIAAFFFNLSFIVFSLLTYHGWLVTYPTINFIFFCTMISVCIAAFLVSHDFQSNFKPYRGLEMLVMASTMGIFIFDFFGIVGVVAAFTSEHNLLGDVPDPSSLNQETSTLAFLVLLDKVSNIIQAFIQSNFMLFMRRVIPRHKSSRRFSNYGIFQGCIIFLALSNLIMWLNDTLVKGKNPQAEFLEAAYFGHQNWAIIIFMTFPFALFYRFNSFLLLMQTALML